MIAYDFSNKVALVIGGTSGIGLASARGFVRAGARVVLAARGEAAAQTARAGLEAEGARVLFVPTDVGDEASVRHAVEATVNHFGRLDFAVNSAGAGGDMAPLLASGGGAIVNIRSIYGQVGRPAHHAYVASKHAVVGLTRSVALEYAPRGIRVNALCAGATRTPAMRQAELYIPEVDQALVAEHPMKRMATEDEVAGAALWLCSDAAGFVTGTPLAVDGGFLAAVLSQRRVTATCPT